MHYNRMKLAKLPGGAFGARGAPRRATGLSAGVPRCQASNFTRIGRPRDADVRTRDAVAHEKVTPIIVDLARESSRRARTGGARHRAAGVTPLSGSAAAPPPHPPAPSAPSVTHRFREIASRCSSCSHSEREKCRRAVDGACRAASEQLARDTLRRPQDRGPPGDSDWPKSDPRGPQRHGRCLPSIRLDLRARDRERRAASEGERDGARGRDIAGRWSERETARGERETEGRCETHVAV